MKLEHVDPGDKKFRDWMRHYREEINGEAPPDDWLDQYLKVLFKDQGKTRHIWWAMDQSRKVGFAVATLQRGMVDGRSQGMVAEFFIYPEYRREGVAKAVAPHLPRPPQPAKGIQHPALPGFNASVQGYSYEPARAKQLFAECGFTGTIRLLVGGGVARSVTAHDDAVAASLRSTLSARVELERVASYEMLLFTAGTGTVPAWVVAWVSDQRNFGYPSFALGIARALVGDPEVRALVERGDALRAEEVMLRKALVIPIVYH